MQNPLPTFTSEQSAFSLLPFTSASTAAISLAAACVSVVKKKNFKVAEKPLDSERWT
jgi:hypothetical protein